MKRIIAMVIACLMLAAPTAVSGAGDFNASEWAQSELTAAQSAGLIPRILEGADLKAPITREEFCEVSLLLYERTSSYDVLPISPNPFSDTDNPEVLKAYNLGITKGTSATTFEPHVSISREQCAAMLFRALRAVRPNLSFDAGALPDFPDQSYISQYAVEAAKYMQSIGVIKGDLSGNFMPRALTPAHVQSGYGTATREAALLMSLRIYNSFNDGGDGEQEPEPEAR